MTGIGGCDPSKAYELFTATAETGKMVCGAVDAPSHRVVSLLEEDSPFPLPPDLKDHFAAAGWARPEIYLAADHRAGISSFAKADASTVADGLRKLSDDLASGEWDTKYGTHRTSDSFDVGYVFVKLD